MHYVRSNKTNWTTGSIKDQAVVYIWPSWQTERSYIKYWQWQQAGTNGRKNRIPTHLPQIRRRSRPHLLLDTISRWVWWSATDIAHHAFLIHIGELTECDGKSVHLTAANRGRFNVERSYVAYGLRQNWQKEILLLTIQGCQICTIQMRRTRCTKLSV